MNKGLKDYTNYLINIIDNQRIQLRLKEEQINGFKKK